MCGASVTVTIVAESGKLTTLSYPPLTTRSVKIQNGESGLASPRFLNTLSNSSFEGTHLLIQRFASLLNSSRHASQHW
ncbi:hypothetical protein DPMN_064283 [Dreissena polymorpha]|uniref:Uncharacterized protein n=1 Tax=Dreissena polymorpha TaxID=45954 RepID=A0A9D4CCG7_DREPO|nr:hypothetical protein DPMN_064283 [Dreissena polymorpha]